MGKIDKNILNEELVAVISAAIASIAERTGTKLVIKSIRRTPQTAPVWGSAGRMERLGNNMNS